MGDITVQYGAYTLPRTTGFYRLTADGEKLTFECPFRVAATSDALFAAACAAAESACQLAYKTLLVNVGGSSLHDIDHAQNEGLLGRASIVKIKGTSRSRHYLFRWECAQPASALHGSTDGFVRHKATVVSESNGRRTVQFTGRYTAHGGSGARAMFDHGTTGGEKRSTDWLAANLTLGETYRGWERIHRTVDVDDQGQIVDYVLTYRERLIPDPTAGGLTTAAAGNSTAQVRSATLSRSVRAWHGFSESPGDRGDLIVTFAIDFVVEYDTTKEYTELSELYVEEIKPALIAYWTNAWTNAPDGLGIVNGDPPLIEETAGLGIDSGTVNARWVILAVAEGDYLAFRESVTRATDHNLRPRHLADGKGSLVVQSPGPTRTAVQEIDAERFQGEPELPLLQPTFGSGRSGWLLSRESEPLVRQFAYSLNGNPVTTTRASVVREYLWISAPDVVITPG